MVDLTGPAATRLSRSGVARRPSAFFQCERRAARLRTCRWRINRTSFRSGDRTVCETTQKARRTSSTVISGYFFPQPVPLQNQPMMRQEGERGVSMPSVPRTGFVVAQPRFVLSLSVTLLDRPSCKSDGEKFFDRSGGRGVALEVLGLSVLVHRGRDQEPTIPLFLFLAAMKSHPYQRSAHSDGPLAAVPDFMEAPGTLGQLAGQIIHPDQAWTPGTSNSKTLRNADWTPKTTFWQGDPNARAARDLQDVSFSVFMQPVVQPRCLPELLISGNPSVRQAGSPRLRDHLVGKLPAGTKDDVLRDPGFSAAAKIPGPFFGQVHPAIQEGVPLLRGVSDVHTDDAVLFLAQLPAPLAGDGNRFVPALGKRRRVDDDDTLRGPKSVAHMLAMLNQESFRVPLRPDDEIFQSVPGDSLIKRDGLNRLALQGTDQPTKERLKVLTLSLAVEDRLVPTDKSPEFKNRLGKGTKRHVPPLFSKRQIGRFAGTFSPNGLPEANNTIRGRVFRFPNSSNHISQQ